MNKLIERANDLNIIKGIVGDILRPNNCSNELQFWNERYGDLWFRAKELNKRKPIGEWVITPPTQIGTYSEIYRDERNNFTRGYFRYNDYEFMVFLHDYLTHLNDNEFIDYSKTLTNGLEELELMIEGNGKLNKEGISIFEDNIRLKKWLTLV